MEPKTLKQPQAYKDLYLRVALSLLASHITVAFGEQVTFFELLLNKMYYVALLSGFIIALTLTTFVNKATSRLDKHYPWIFMPLQRAVLQLAFGFIIPAILAFLLAWVYFSIFGIHILETVYLRYDFPIILFMLLVLNLYYLAFYFYRQMRLAEVKAHGIKPHGTQTAKDEVKLKGFVQVDEAARGKKIVLVKEGNTNIPVEVSDVAYFYREGDFNFIRIFNGKKYFINQTLDELEKQFGGVDFFRANRRMLVSLKACREFKPIEHDKLWLFVAPETKEPVVISQNKAKNFRKWLER